MSRVKKVDLYENGTIAIVEAVSPELGNRVQRVRVQLPGTSQACLASATGLTRPPALLLHGVALAASESACCCAQTVCHLGNMQAKAFWQARLHLLHGI